MKDMNQLKNTLTLIFLIALATIGKTQNCYEVLSDATGIDRTQNQSELETVACELRQAFPTEFKNQFKVFGFGFYSQNEYMEGGFDKFWDMAKEDAAVESPFYLLMGRQLPDSQGNSKMWFDLKLPNEGNFACITEEERNIIYNNIEYVLTNTFTTNFSSLEFNYSEIAAMQRLKLIVEEVVNCCQTNFTGETCSFCIPSDDFIQEYLLSEGFSKIDLSFEIDGIVSAKEKDESAKKRSTGDYVTDYANLSILIDGEIVDIEKKLETELDAYAIEGNNPKFFIIKNSNLCDGTYETVRNEIDDNLPNLSGIIYIRDDVSENDEMYAVVYGVLNEELEGVNGYSIGDLEESTSNSISSFQQLVPM